MALKLNKNWRRLVIPECYARVEKSADSRNNDILVGFYACEDAKKIDGDTPIWYSDPILIPADIHSTMFSEATLKQPDVTALSQSYVYLKTLPEFENSENC
jgi:hypothetical protein